MKKEVQSANKTPIRPKNATNSPQQHTTQNRYQVVDTARAIQVREKFNRIVREKNTTKKTS